ncbi:hypothetical protein CLAIMM_03558 [Cladophialophora immunda]|nr:hypothetical protein CLAIMM_03558 [Cladophialophora immunda]
MDEAIHGHLTARPMFLAMVADITQYHPWLKKAVRKADSGGRSVTTREAVIPGSVPNIIVSGKWEFRSHVDLMRRAETDEEDIGVEWVYDDHGRYVRSKVSGTVLANAQGQRDFFFALHQ